MARQTAAYVYGSAARNLEARPLPRREEEIRRRRQVQPAPKSKKKIDKVAVLLTCITFLAVMFVGISYIHLQFESTYLSKSVVNLQSEVVNMEKENAAAKMELDNSMNLTHIYEKATKELGMKQAREDQIFTYVSRKSTQVRQHGTIPTE